MLLVPLAREGQGRERKEGKNTILLEKKFMTRTVFMTQ
jgi:hypothetical protein